MLVYIVSINELQGEQNGANIGCIGWQFGLGFGLIEIDASHCGLNRVYSWHLSSEDNCRQS